MTDGRGWWRVCAFAGFVTVATAVYFGMIPNLEGCGPTGSTNAIIAFEIVRVPFDVAVLFGAEPCTSPFTSAMRHATWVDALIFIPAYTLFLCAGLMAMRGRGPKIALTGIVAMLLAALFDELEGVQLFTIMNTLPGTQETINWLIPLVRGKFALLGFAAMLTGWLLSRAGGWQRLAGLVVTVGAALTIVGLYSDDLARFLGLGGAVSWLMLFIVAMILSFRKSQPA